MIEFLSQPWPWYVAGPLIGLMVPLLLVLTGKGFGVSSSLRHFCAATFPGQNSYLNYNWRQKGLWNMVFVMGIVGGGFLAGTLLQGTGAVAISGETITELSGLGFTDFDGLVPAELFSWASLKTVPGFIALVLGGFLVGFGARYAGGCTSGHAITGLSSFQKASLFATIGFFIGGLIVTHLVYPWIF